MTARRFIAKRTWDAPEPDEPEDELSEEEIEQNRLDLEDHAAEAWIDRQMEQP